MLGDTDDFNKLLADLADRIILHEDHDLLSKQYNFKCTRDSLSVVCSELKNQLPHQTVKAIIDNLPELRVASQSVGGTKPISFAEEVRNRKALGLGLVWMSGNLTSATIMKYILADTQGFPTVNKEWLEFVSGSGATIVKNSNKLRIQKYLACTLSVFFPDCVFLTRIDV